MCASSAETLRADGGFSVRICGRLAGLRTGLSAGVSPLALLWAFAAPLPAVAAEGDTVDELKRMSIEELADMEVTSVSKRGEALIEAPAAIYVITSADIEARAVSSLPQALRLAPNLDVAQTSPSAFNVASRGLSGNPAAQSFPNKLLVLIDGRSVYSPLYSGIYWDMQNVMLNDVDRIEVISGPGATLWGANAVNGVINVTSKNSADTQGGLLDLRGSTRGGGGALRYGGRIDEDLTYRVYATGFARKSFANANGTSVGNGWSSSQGGFRFDWERDSDLVTVQGDLYRIDADRPGNPVQRGRGANVVARWSREFADGSSFQLQGYYDHVYRGLQNDAGASKVSTYDLEFQHSFNVLGWNRIVWGIGERITPYTLRDSVGANALLFQPASRTLYLTNAFVEDHITINDALDLTVGIKVEDDPYSGISPMPSARLAWRPWEDTLLWAAASRAVRSPTPFDTDVVERVGAIEFLRGDPGFLPEELTAYEVGYRGILTPNLSLSISGFWDVYDQLRSIELSPAGGLPLHWGNGMEGRIYGIEAWADLQMLEWWRLSAGASTLRSELRFQPGSSRLFGIAQAGNDPHFRASLRSLMSIGDAVTFVAIAQYVGRRFDPALAPLIEASVVATWKLQPHLELYALGSNLLHDSHVQFSPGGLIKRSVTGGVRWRF